MSFFAGIYSLKKEVLVPAAAVAEMCAAFSRCAEEEIVQFSSAECTLLKADIGAFGSIGSVDHGGGRFTVISGEALLPGLETSGREAELEAIRRALATGDLSVLVESRGVFSAADLDANGTLTLITDRLGIRPVYYCTDDEILVFSSALRILESMSVVPKKMDLRAVTEIAALGYALADRTPYCDVKLLGAGGVLRANKGTIELSAYADWNDIPVSARPEAELIDGLYKRFADAVTIRQRCDRGAVAYLSGGLDSRCVCAVLREQAENIHAFNFAREDTQDQIFGRQFAQAAGAIYTEVPKSAGDKVPDYSTMLAEQWRRSPKREAAPVERPSIAWSGEGGSVDLGHVHITEPVVKLMRSGDSRAAITEFLKHDEIALPIKLFRKNIREAMSQAVVDGILEQIETYRCEDPARKFYLFLMLNDQRRKLARHFEGLDEHRMEFQLPFFDMDFVAFIMTIPMDMCLRHKLYVKWLERFPPPTASVPWQSYPGHVPCPIESASQAAYQWDSRHVSTEWRALKRSLVKRAAKVLRAKDFPEAIFDKKLFGAALAAYAIGLRDYGYLVETAEVYYKYWNRCSGNYMPLAAK